MNNRERFRAALAFEPVDKICHMELNIWDDTYKRWLNEGIPQDVKIIPKTEYYKNRKDIFGYLGVCTQIEPALNHYYLPAFERQVIEETEDYIIEKNGNGVTLKINKRNQTIPDFLDYPIKNRRDYEEYRGRLCGNIDKRYPADWDNIVKYLKEQQTNIVRVVVQGFFGYPRELMGLVPFLETLYDDPGFIKEIINDRVKFNIEICEKAIKDIQPDFVFIWEDCCYNNGPLISPAMFREFMLPAYKQFTSFVKGLGVKNIFVDCDGDITKLTPLWLEGGVTGLLPFEVRAGMDVIKVAEELPGLQILGGIDKTEIALGRKYIDNELKRVLPYMRKRGGYIASFDHHIHPEVSLEDFKYYVEEVAKY